MRGFAIALTFFTVAGLSAALAEDAADTWAKGIWEQEAFGHPSITNGPGGVSVVLTEEALVDANNSGITRDRAVKALLERWAPTMCQPKENVGSIVDFSRVQKNMRVELRTQRLKADGRIIDLRTGETKHRQRYVVGDDSIFILIDYRPRDVKCVSPEDIAS